MEWGKGEEEERESWGRVGRIGRGRGGWRGEAGKGTGLGRTGKGCGEGRVGEERESRWADG